MSPKAGRITMAEVYFRINHMLNIRSIRKKMVDLLGQDHPKPVSKPKTILNQHEPIPDSARKEVFRDKRLNGECRRNLNLCWAFFIYHSSGSNKWFNLSPYSRLSKLILLLLLRYSLELVSLDENSVAISIVISVTIDHCYQSYLANGGPRWLKSTANGVSMS
ncbi:hypothetical protein YC2023_000565 [Brassica napus]